MTVIAAGRKAAPDHIHPTLAIQGLPQQSNGRRIALADHALLIQHHHASRQGLEQSRQPVGQLFLFLQLLLTLKRLVGEFTGKLVYAGFQGSVGVGNLPGHAIKQFKRRVHGLITLLWKQSGDLVINISSGIGT